MAAWTFGGSWISAVSESTVLSRHLANNHGQNSNSKRLRSAPRRTANQPLCRPALDVSYRCAALHASFRRVQLPTVI
jgi:hypothetical protein